MGLLTIWKLTGASSRYLVSSADRDSQDKNLVSSLDRFAKTAGLRDSVDSVLTHVYPCLSSVRKTCFLRNSEANEHQTLGKVICLPGPVYLLVSDLIHSE